MITVPVRWRRRFALVSGAVLLALSLGACSTAEKLFQGRDIDYKSSGTLPPLEIPPDLTSPTRDDRYIVPDSGKSATTFSVHQAQSAQRQRSRVVPFV